MNLHQINLKMLQYLELKIYYRGGLSMFNKYFGNYILVKQVVTSEQLRKILKKQQSSNVKLGVLAIESGYMEAPQVNRVHHLQLSRDQRFGEIAVEENYLTQEELNTLLNKQKDSHITIGQVLIDEHILTYEDYEQLLISYKQDSGFSSKEIEVLKSNNTDAIVRLFIQTEQNQHAEIFKEYIELFIRNMVRFIDSNIIIDRPYLTDSYEYANLSSQKIYGPNHIVTGISALDTVYARFAEIYTDEIISEVNDDAKDAVGEFMNCQNGLFVSNLYHKNIHYDLEPQQYWANGTLTPDTQLYIVPCKLSFGNFDIIFNI